MRTEFMPDNASWCTIFIICGDSLDPAEVKRRMKFEPTAFVRSGEIEVPTIEGGSTRSFDPRLSLDQWKRSLSGRQYKRSLAEQLQYWSEKLMPAESALRDFRARGYWTVIDCQGFFRGTTWPATMQFRIPVDVRMRLAHLELDLEFAIYGVGSERDA